MYSLATASVVKETINKHKYIKPELWNDQEMYEATIEINLIDSPIFGAQAKTGHCVSLQLHRVRV
jgi:hypothetical protein